MQITDQRKRLPALLVVLVLGYGMVACGVEEPGTTSGVDASVASDEVPERLLAVLERDGMQARGVVFDAGDLSASEALDSFAKSYDPKSFETAPVPYSIAIDASEEARLPEGNTAWMLHIPGVAQDVSGPVQEKPGEGHQNPVQVDTDMFTFIDTRTGEHLLTVYVGPEGLDLD